MASKKRNGLPRRSGSRRRLANPSETTRYEVTSYEVTSKTPKDIPENEFPPEVADQLQRLYDLMQSRPGDAVVELKRWIGQYPDCAKLYNFLSASYHRIGDHANRDQVGRETYKRFPNYLFAKTAYAEVCMSESNLDEIPVIFDGKYDLSQLYPNRKRFHFSEVGAFAAVMGLYFVRRGDFKQAKFYYDVLKELQPDHPRVLQLERHFLMATLERARTRSSVRPRP